MNPNEIIDKFIEKIFEIKIFQYAAKRAARKELIETNEIIEFTKNDPAQKETTSSLHNMIFRSSFCGTNIPVKFKEITIEEKTKRILYLKNKQYCWLLAEAYEHFEDFLEEMYAYIGFDNQNQWLLSDFGNISLNDISGKNYTWYLEKIKNKKDAQKHILARLHALFPTIMKNETSNRLDLNLNFFTTLIEHLRHIIVHNGGKTQNKEDFIKKVIQKSGLWNNGNFDKKYEEDIRILFGTGKYENEVIIIEIQTMTTPFEVSYDIHNDLINKLLAHAEVIYHGITGNTYKEWLRCTG